VLALAAVPTGAGERAHAIGVEQHGIGQLSAHYGALRCDLPGAAGYRIDLDDAPDPPALRAAPGAVVAVRLAGPLSHGTPGTAPPLHRACARPPTGPPST
jgi:hypothetical protein